MINYFNDHMWKICMKERIVFKATEYLCISMNLCIISVSAKKCIPRPIFRLSLYSLLILICISYWSTDDQYWGKYSELTNVMDRRCFHTKTRKIVYAVTLRVFTFTKEVYFQVIDWFFVLIPNWVSLPIFDSMFSFSST